jgi:hypothetical protein
MLLCSSVPPQEDAVLTEEAAGPLLAQWQNFYVIAGSSAGALTGLQFVVMALIADSELTSGMPEVRAFGTPTVVHFCAALLISAIASAPWQQLSAAAIALGACGAAGLVYAMFVIKHAIRQTGYKPDAEDWFWYAALPLLAYAALTAAAILLPRYRAWPLFVIAATTLLLLFDGIHNAWDTVTYVAVHHGGRPKKSAGETPQEKSPERR